MKIYYNATFLCVFFPCHLNLRSCRFSVGLLAPDTCRAVVCTMLWCAMPWCAVVCRSLIALVLYVTCCAVRAMPYLVVPCRILSCRAVLPVYGGLCLRARSRGLCPPFVPSFLRSFVPSLGLLAPGHIHYTHPIHRIITISMPSWCSCALTVLHGHTIMLRQRQDSVKGAQTRP